MTRHDKNRAALGLLPRDQIKQNRHKEELNREVAIGMTCAALAAFAIVYFFF